MGVRIIAAEEKQDSPELNMKIFLDYAFLENFFLSENQSENYFYLKRILSDVKNRFELIVDFDLEEAYQNPEKRAIVRQITAKQPLTNGEFIEQAQAKAFHETGEPKLFFIDSLPLPITERFGCFVTNSKEIDKISVLFHTEDFRIDRNSFDWSMLKRVKHPCNSIIITDNYLLQNDLTEENTLSLLISLMPDSLESDFPFHLTIIGYSSKDFKEVAKQHASILAKLQAKFSYKINLSIIRADYHGRYIFTNYYRIQSEKGFGLFQRGRIRPNDETSIDCKPVTQYGIHTNVLEILNQELKKCQSICRTERLPNMIAGNRENRLLNW